MASSLADTLYPLPDRRRTVSSLVGWWESRRPVFNQAVGAAGLVTLAGLFVLHPERSDLFHPELVTAVVVYGLLANVCYTFGWITELLAKLVWGRGAPRMGPLLFRQGLIFSVGLTLFPLLVVGMIRAVMLVLWVMGLVT